MAYLISKNDSKALQIKDYRFKSEGSHKISPQEILAINPSLITDIPELEMVEVDIPLIIREFSTARGSIDILYLSANADIFIIETKLFRNPESHRAVVAQVIDYVKALSIVDIEDLLLKASSSNYSDSDFIIDDYFRATLKKNIDTGNFTVVVAGDRVHSNVLGMVESIQSAPHLSFSIFLVELLPKELDNNTIVIFPRLIAKTIETERSVIKIEISREGDSHKVESSTPEKERKGSKPILSEDEYLNNIEKPEFIPIIQNFLNEWRDKGGDVRFGTVGFSAGMLIDDKRIPVQFVYQRMVAIVSDKWRQTCGIPDSNYNAYKEYFKNELPNIYDRYIIGNHVEVKFKDINSEELKIILNASYLIVGESQKH